MAPATDKLPSRAPSDLTYERKTARWKREPAIPVPSRTSI